MTIELRRLLALPTLLFLLSACSLNPLKGSSESKASNPGVNSPTTGSAFSPSSDARKDLRDAFERLNGAYPYRLTETMTDLANSQNTLPGGIRVVEFAAADRSHMKWTRPDSGDVETISIGNKHYWYSNGKWTEGTSQVPYQGADFAKKVAETIKEVKYVGPGTVNGSPCHLYTCTFDGSMAGQSWNGTGKIWIGAHDGLPHQSDSDIKFGNYAGKSHIVYEYGVNIKVEPPAL
jgi:hypothetical protein